MVPLGFVIAGFFAWRHTVLLWKNPHRESLNGLPTSKQLIILFACIFAGAIIGSRIFYVVWHIDRYRANLTEVFLIFNGGFISFGGTVFALLFAVWYMKSKGISVLKTGDLVALYLPVADALRRLGCFLNGCCFGRPDHSPFGVFLPHSIVARYPTPLYFVAWYITMFFILRIITKKTKTIGVVFMSYFLLDCFGRFFIEFFREEYSYRKGPLIIPQVICIFGFVLTAGIILKLLRDT